MNLDMLSSQKDWEVKERDNEPPDLWFQTQPVQEYLLYNIVTVVLKYL